MKGTLPKFISQTKELITPGYIAKNLGFSYVKIQKEIHPLLGKNEKGEYLENESTRLQAANAIIDASIKALRNVEAHDIKALFDAIREIGRLAKSKNTAIKLKAVQTISTMLDLVMVKRIAAESYVMTEVAERIAELKKVKDGDNGKQMPYVGVLEG